ncbi:MAG: sigma-70 family RNA polymerase sigma factor [Phycisphaerales bacterium]
MSGILERLARGDQSAADDCVREYGGLVWRLGCRYLDQAESEIEDAVQDVFVEIWLHAKRYDPAKGSEAAFIATIAHRRLIDRQRRITMRRRKISKYADQVINGSRNPVSIEVKEQADRRGSLYRQELEAGFRSLPDDERNALWLSVFHGLSHRDISEATSVPIGTVKSRLRRAMIRLTKSISGRPAQVAVKGGQP